MGLHILVAPSYVSGHLLDRDMIYGALFTNRDIFHIGASFMDIFPVFMYGQDCVSVPPYGKCPIAKDHDSESLFGRCSITGGYKCSVCV